MHWPLPPCASRGIGVLHRSPVLRNMLLSCDPCNMGVDHIDSREVLVEHTVPKLIPSGERRTRLYGILEECRSPQHVAYRESHSDPRWVFPLPFCNVPFNDTAHVL